MCQRLCCWMEQGEFDETEVAGAGRKDNYASCRENGVCGLTLRAKGKEFGGCWEYGRKGAEIDGSLVIPPWRSTCLHIYKCQSLGLFIMGMKITHLAGSTI